MRPESEAALIRRAKEVLEANWCGSYTKPAPKLYPHQWNWDSGFIALGYAHYDQERAYRELESLFRGQWENGMLPHIVFNPVTTEYFPGPERWEIERSPAAPRGVRTSGISNPPVHALAALRILEGSDAEPGRAFLRWVFPKLVAFHRYLYRERDPEREGLVFIRHPWESGTDNSPAYDEPLRRIDLEAVSIPPYQRKDLDVVSADQRPTRGDYDRYVYLLEVFKDARYEEGVLFRECPFVVQDPLFNAILCRAGEALVEIAETLGEDAGELREWPEQTRRGMEQKLWDEERGVYSYYDVRGGRLLATDALSGLMPLFGGVPDLKRARRLLERLESPGFSGRDGELVGVPSYAADSPAFDPAKYWRGPVWINMDWMLAQGLDRYGFRERARAVRRDALELVRRYGFYEYFGPYRDEAEGRAGGLGSPDFSWTAALLIDLLSGESPG